MWGLLQRSTQITIMVVAVAYVGWLVSQISSLIAGAPLSPLKSTSIVGLIIGVGIVGAAGVAWRWLWRSVPWLSKWYPDLTGRWKGKYLSNYQHADGQHATGPMTVVIRQGLFETTVSAWTSEMNSHSTRSWHEADRAAQRFRLGYTYRSEPKAAVRDRSNPHDGVCWLDFLPDADPERLRGLYYTERRTLGDMELHRVSRDLDTNSSTY